MPLYEAPSKGEARAINDDNDPEEQLDLPDARPAHLQAVVPQGETRAETSDRLDWRDRDTFQTDVHAGPETEQAGTVTVKEQYRDLDKESDDYLHQDLREMLFDNAKRAAFHYDGRGGVELGPQILRSFQKLSSLVDSLSDISYRLIIPGFQEGLQPMLINPTVGDLHERYILELEMSHLTWRFLLDRVLSPVADAWAGETGVLFNRLATRLQAFSRHDEQLPTVVHEWKVRTSLMISTIVRPPVKIFEDLAEELISRYYIAFKTPAVDKLMIHCAKSIIKTASELAKEIRTQSTDYAYHMGPRDGRNSPIRFDEELMEEDEFTRARILPDKPRHGPPQTVSLVIRPCMVCYGTKYKSFNDDINVRSKMKVLCDAEEYFKRLAAARDSEQGIQQPGIGHQQPLQQASGSRAPGKAQPEVPAEATTPSSIEARDTSSPGASRTEAMGGDGYDYSAANGAGGDDEQEDDHMEALQAPSPVPAGARDQSVEPGTSLRPRRPAAAAALAKIRSYNQSQRRPAQPDAVSSKPAAPAAAKTKGAKTQPATNRVVKAKGKGKGKAPAAAKAKRKTARTAKGKGKAE